MCIFLKHLWLISNILKWQDCKTFIKLVPSQTPSRTSQRKCSVKKIFLKIYKISRENACVGVCFLNFIKKRLQHRCFLVKFAKFLRTPNLKNIYKRLPLPFLGFRKLNITSSSELLLKRGPRPCTRTLKNVDPEKPGPRKTWSLKNLDPEKPGPWKTWA